MQTVFSGTTLLHYKENVFLELISDKKAVREINVGFSFRYPHVLSYQKTLEEAAAFAVGKARTYNSQPIIMEGPLFYRFRSDRFTEYLKVLPLDAVWRLMNGLNLSDMPDVSLSVAQPKITDAQKYFERFDDPLFILDAIDVTNQQRSLIVIPASYSVPGIDNRQIRVSEVKK